jgi:hypothetical protein
MTRITGFRPGFKKIPFTQFLIETQHFGLKAALEATDALLGGATLTLDLTSEEVEYLHALGANSTSEET